MLRRAMFDPKIKISRELFEKLKEASIQMGCASPEEFAIQVLEREIKRILATSSSKRDLSEEEIKDIESKLQGLGYIE